jgi:hypothetical protein
MLNEDLRTKSDRLSVDKDKLNDALADKAQEIHSLTDMYDISNLGTINAEMDVYIKSMSAMKDEQSLALKGLKVFID